MKCPDADTLAALGALPDAERFRIVDHAASCEACRAALALEETAAESGSLAIASEPAMIGRYRIEHRLGAGAMGVVYAAYDPELDRRIAVKLVKPRASPDRLRREAQTLAKLSHANIVAVHDVGMHEGMAFVAMALVDGENLRVWLRRSRSPAEILAKLVQAARGIIAAHAEGVIHRDLKPDNIFISARGEVLVGDFGLARASGPPSGAAIGELTQSGAVMGTPVYMPPESFTGESTAASDQFALCVTMWEALYGARPFHGTTVDELVRAISAGPPSPPRGRDVPARVHAVLVRGLAAEPGDRFPSVAALVEALTHRRRRWPYFIAALVAVAAGGAAFASTRPDRQHLALAACDATNARALHWTPVRRGIALAELTGRHAATGRAVADLADCYATGWLEVAHDACTTTEPAPVTACLARSAELYGLVIDDLRNQPLLLDARGLLEALPSPERCRGVAVELAPSPQLTDLQREIDLRSLSAAQHQPLTPELFALARRAEQLGDVHTRAEAEAVVGETLLANGQPEAEAHLRSAIALADRSHDDRLRAMLGGALARLLVRSGRTVEATLVRDNAASAAARANDRQAQFAVERANAELVAHTADAAALVPVLRNEIALGTGRCGPTIETDLAQVQLGTTLAQLHDPSAPAEIEKGRAALAQSGEHDESLAMTLARLAGTEPDLARRIALKQQLLPIIPDEQFAIATRISLAQDLELATDYALSYRLRVEAIARLDQQATPDRAELADLVLDAAAVALDGAEASDDPPTRARLLREALALLERRPDDYLRGRALYLQGHAHAAIPFLERALVAAEAQQPPTPGRVAGRASYLAHALWDTGERARAKGYATTARAMWTETRALFAGQEATVGAATIRVVEKRAAAFDAWFTAHF